MTRGPWVSFEGLPTVWPRQPDCTTRALDGDSSIPEAGGAYMARTAWGRPPKTWWICIRSVVKTRTPLLTGHKQKAALHARRQCVHTEWMSVENSIPRKKAAALILSVHKMSLRSLERHG